MPKKSKIAFVKAGREYTYNVFEGKLLAGSLVPVGAVDFQRFPALWAGSKVDPPWWKVINRDGVLLGLVAYSPDGYHGKSTFEDRRMSAANILLS